MKERKVLCIYYEYAGKCKIRKEGCTALGHMQKCGKYKPNLDLKPFRQNKKKQKLEEIKRKEEWE